MIAPISRSTPIIPTTAPQNALAPAPGARAPSTAQVIATWSKDWQTALHPRSAVDQATLNQHAQDVIREIQQAFAGDGPKQRAQHAKAVYTTTNASFRSAADLDPALAHGPFAAGNKLRAIVRISNVSGKAEGDDAKDLRGIAIRLTDDQGHVQDLLMNTSAEFMAKDAPAALVGAEARGVGLKAIVRGILHGQVGPIAAVKMIIAGKRVASDHTSIAAHSFWSRTPFQLGDHAVKLRL
ncbi:MAG: catalase, partial [Cyanobacteria bacterium RYN_339]|nr:catalase [Cyanobacteria bacterium RYN_339]